MVIDIYSETTRSDGQKMEREGEKRTGERHLGWSDRVRFRVDARFITTTIMMTMVELQESLGLYTTTTSSN